MATGAGEPFDPRRVRVSDADRQAVVDLLSRAAGEGLLTLEELSEASGAAYASRSRAELEAVVADLHLPTVPDTRAAVPGAAPIPQAAPPAPRRWVVAVMSGEDRRGRWQVGRRVGAFALMGGVDLDLRDAVFEEGEVEITAWAVMGGVDVIVPEGIPVETSGFVLMGGRTTRIADVAPIPGAPIVRVRGYGLWGAVTTRSRKRRAEREAERRARRDERARRHDERDAARRSHRAAGPPPALPAPPAPPAPPPLPSPRALPSAEPATWPPAPPPPAARPASPPLRSVEPTTGPPARPRPSVPDDGPAARPRSGPSSPTASPVHAPGVGRSGLVTIVCTDIVGSTRYADLLGDQEWRTVLLAHNTLVRAEVARHGGTEIKTSGDGFLLTFASARSAVQFAVALQDALVVFRAERPATPLEVRVAVHAGEVERDGTDVVGRNVTVACRLCDAADPGEVLASAVVADLADSASDLTFGEPRTLRLAGIDRELRAHPASRR